MDYKDLFETFTSKKVLVIGDLCLDEYIYGTVDKISPEFAVPRITVTEKKYVPGGAGNVSCGLAALGAEVFLCSVIGKVDTNGDILIRELVKRKVNVDGVVRLPAKVTPTFSRVVSRGNQLPQQHVARYDMENKTLVDCVDELVDWILQKLEDVDAVVFGDFHELGGGIVTKSLIDRVVVRANELGIVTVGDSRDSLMNFERCTFVVPNDKEASAALGKSLESDEDFAKAGDEIRKKLNLELCVITRGEDGVSVVSDDGVFHLSSIADSVVDVCGAGDSVTSILTLCRVANLDLEESLRLAMLAASEAVSKEGTVSVTSKDLLDKLNDTDAWESAFIEERDLSRLSSDLRGEGLTIVARCGVFDVLHPGHVASLAESKKLGDVQVVVINSDKAVKEYKGESRPLMSEKDRALMLSHLKSVDFVCVSDDLRPGNWLESLRPDFFVVTNDFGENCKSNYKDYVLDVVSRVGSKMVVLNKLEGYSTSHLIRKARE